MTSHLEQALLDQIAAAGLPMPVTQFRMASRWHLTPKLLRARTFIFDFQWPRYLLLVEVDGGTFMGKGHTSGRGYQYDRDKDNEAQERGWLMLRYTASDIRAGRAITQIRRIIEQRRQIIWIMPASPCADTAEKVLVR